MDIKTLESLVKKIESYSKSEQIRILTIISEDNVSSFSENTNGTFIKMEELSEVTINKIQKYIEYTEQNEKNICRVESEINEIKKDLNI